MFQRTKTGAAAAIIVAGGAVLFSASAQSQQQPQRIEITGSSIKRIDGEAALPVTVIKTEDLLKQGVTTAEQAVQRIASNQSNFGVSQAVGATTGGKAEADLRGLGGPTGSNANKTLVLLNGRRIANHSFDAAAVDLNAIPLGAVDRVEVLRDGASSLYGTDAIGGVINFILKRNFSGVEISAGLQKPEAGSGGGTTRASVVGGFNTERFNLLAALDVRKQKALAAVDRGFGATGILGPRRADISAGTSGSAFPGDVGGFEPSAPNCDPPFSMPRNTNADNSGAFGSCRYDFSKSVDLIPENKQVTALVRGTFNLAPSHTLSAEVLTSNNKATSRVAPAPTSHLIPQSSPFWPAGATAELIQDLASSDPNAQVLGGVVNWRQVPAGKRTSGDNTTTQRALVELEGDVAGFDYRAAVGTSRNKSIASVKGGYVNDTLIQRGVFNGTINPFGRHTDPNFGQTPAGVAAIAAAQVYADTVIGKSTLDFADVRASKELFAMGGGKAAMSLGAEVRREKSSFENTDITAELGSLGVDPDGDTTGSRKIAAIYAELNLPFVKGFDVTLAGRYDKYSDFGGTFNPKLGFRFKPTPEVLLRGSANKGFRAPTLYEVYQPQSLSFTSDSYNDPLLCPGGVPVAGASAGVVCDQQVLQRTVGPATDGRGASAVKPEKSTAFSLGIAIEPATDLTLTFDVWRLKVTNLISGLPEQEIFNSASRYASRFVRCSQLPTGAGPGIRRGDVDACLNTAFDPIAYINAPTENLGNLQVSGMDFSAAWRGPATDYGRFGFTLDGTYLTKYQYQREANGAYIDALGRYSDNAPVFRWQHVLGGSWSITNWSFNLSQRYKSGYVDQGGASDVVPYFLHDGSVTYTGIKGLTFTAGIQNFFDNTPPRTVQTTTFQRGYDPRFTDPLGRTYMLRMAYRF
jgi:iron complex outermembrane recepter protein